MIDKRQSKISEPHKKKILYVITKSNFGGAQKYIYELATEIKHDFDVSVAFGGNGVLKEKLESAGIKTISIKSLQRDINLMAEIKAFFELIKIFKNEKPDVIHLNSSKIGAMGSLAAKISTYKNKKHSGNWHPKTIFTIHGLAFNENRNFLSKLIIKKIYWLTFFWSDISIAVSKNIKDQIIRLPLFGFIEDKIKVIQNQIRPIQFNDRNESRDFIFNRINEIQIKDKSDNLVLENGQKIIGTIAELHHIKGLNYLIDSAKQIVSQNPTTVFVVFGEGEERKNLERQIVESGLKNNFFLLGFVSDAQKYLKGIDLFVLNSLSEGLALSILEAQNANLPIIATNVGGAHECSRKYPNMELIKSRDINGLAEKISEFLNGKILNKPSTQNTAGNFIEMVRETTRLY
jgi:glycosyltransferase involved in cell wall biosynthesis